MQSFLLPTANTTKIDKINRNFLWNKDENSSSPNLIGLDKVCQPKCYGGLGLRKASVNNIALQLKLLWRIIKDPNNMWVLMVSKKYLKLDDLWQHIPSSASSWQWKKLMSLRPIMRKGLRWQVGNGAHISFWFDNWVYAFPLADLFPEVYKDASLKVSDFIHQGNQWNSSLLGTLVPQDIVKDISALYLPSSNV